MKKLFSLLALTAALSFVACNSSKKEDKGADKKMETKDQPMMANDKEHVCTDKCKDGNPAYAHGEKGHTCTEECKNGKM